MSQRSDQKKFPAIVAELGLQLPNAALSNKPGTAKILTEKNLAGYRRSSEPTGFIRGAGHGMPVSTAQHIVEAIQSQWANSPDVVEASLPRMAKLHFFGLHHYKKIDACNSGLHLGIG